MNVCLCNAEHEVSLVLVNHILGSLRPQQGGLRLLEEFHQEGEHVILQEGGECKFRECEPLSFSELFFREEGPFPESLEFLAGIVHLGKENEFLLLLELLGRHVEGELCRLRFFL